MTKSEIKCIYNSLSWKITRPLRYLKKVFNLIFYTLKEKSSKVLGYVLRPRGGDILEYKKFDHYISLGDNCEVGLQFMRYGYNESSFFRYVACDIDSLANLIENEFNGIFLFENLVPSYDDMVRDVKYGIAFHSDMKSSIVDGVRVFLHEEVERKQVYQAEYSKVIYLLEKWRSQILARESVLYFIKSNREINKEQFSAIFGFIDPYGSGNVKLVNLVDRDLDFYVKDGRLIYECVSRFAPFDRATDAVIGEYDYIFKKYGLLC